MIEATDCQFCKSCGMDMDLEPYCANETVTKKVADVEKRGFPFGINLSSQLRVRSNYCKGEFFEQHPDRKPPA
jgi:hypothetical protein